MQNIHIATTIKLLCKARGISINAFLKECELTKSFIYDLEKRNASPSADKLTKISNYFDCSVIICWAEQTTLIRIKNKIKRVTIVSTKLF